MDTQTPDDLSPNAAAIILHIEAQRNQALTQAALAGARADRLAATLTAAEAHIAQVEARVAELEAKEAANGT